MEYRGKKYYTSEDLLKMGYPRNTIKNWFYRPNQMKYIESIYKKVEVKVVSEENLKKLDEQRQRERVRLGLDKRTEDTVKKTGDTTEDKTEEDKTEVEGEQNVQGAHWC